MAHTKQEANNIVIDAQGDLKIKVVEYDYGVDEVRGERPVLKVAFMQVNTHILRDSSRVWKTMLNPTGPWNEASGAVVELHDDTVVSLELWLRCLHGTMTEDMNIIPRKEIWYALEVCRKYFLKIEMLNGWFASWWSNQDKKKMSLDDLRELLYPCHEFEHLKGFSYLTKRLVYEAIGHITEINPTHHRHLHLRHPIIQQLNAAKGSMRTVLHRGLFKFIKRFLDQSCPCKERALFQYCKALDRTHIWPLEEWGSKKSINELTDGLELFRYDAPAKGCNNCTYNIGVRQTCVDIEQYFDGLCLLCMDSSTTASRDPDAAYWKHDRKQEYDHVPQSHPHGQPTWYFSFMGRKDEMDAHKRSERERKRGF